MPISASKPIVLLLLAALPAVAQVNTGELRLQVKDAAQRGLEASVTIASDAAQFRKSLKTDEAGRLDLKTLPFGLYRITCASAGFAPVVESADVHSAIPVERVIELAVAPVATAVQVDASGTLIDPYSPSATSRIGLQEIASRVSSLPGRSVQDLVDSQPGWLYEGNAVLHPRGSEYQTQFVVDGIPLTDNRSPSFGPEIEADDIASMMIYTAGIPAEYGRKMGGVVELDTHDAAPAGLHGKLVLAGGSYDSASAYGQLQDVFGKNVIGVSASGAMTDHYLNPVVPQNFTNNGTTADFSVRFERDLTEADRLILNVRHELSRFLIPNELVQQQAGQIQNGDNFETLGGASYQHIVSPNLLFTAAGMVRDNANDLYSNPSSTPIIALQHNNFREGYFKSTVSLHRGRNEFKAGVEADTTFLHENFSYSVTDDTQFDPSTPLSLAFHAARPDLEQSGFLEDLVRLGNWTFSAGLRWDHYQLLLNQNAFSPRVSLGRYLPSLNLVLHASYDRVFQTPSFENILISSSPQIEALDSDFLRLPVQPSRGNYYEAGATKGFASRVRLDANLYRRDASNYADDDQLLNTGVSYPIAFRKSVIYGAEAKLELVRLGRFSGFASYSYMVGAVWFPVTGGLFLGDDASAALTQTSGHFPDSQDQRNTLRTRLRYQLSKRIWFAAGSSYGSGLPFAYTGDEADALAEYGPAVIDRINFDRGRILPTLALNASASADVLKSDAFTLRLQADGDNLNGRLNVIDFGGLFSGNAIAPARSFTLRLNAGF